MYRFITALTIIFSLQTIIAQKLPEPIYTEFVTMAPKIIPIGSYDFQRVKKYYEQIKSEKGSISYISSRKAIVVYDTPEKIGKMSSFASRIFKAARLMIGLKLEYMRVAGSKVEKEEYNPAWKVKVKGDKVIIPLISGFGTNKDSLSKSNKSEKKISIFPGKTITITAGKPEGDIEQFLDFIMDPETILVRDGKLFRFPNRVYPEKMRSFLKMTTHILKKSGRVELEIFPVLEMTIKKKVYIFKIASLATRSQIRLNRQLAVGILLYTRAEPLEQLFGNNLFEEKNGRALYDLCISSTLSR